MLKASKTKLKYSFGNLLTYPTLVCAPDNTLLLTFKVVNNGVYYVQRDHEE